jgi:hypothetical protein
MPAGMKRKFAIRLVLMVALGLLSALAVGAWAWSGGTASADDTHWGGGTTSADDTHWG